MRFGRYLGVLALTFQSNNFGVKLLCDFCRFALFFL